MLNKFLEAISVVTVLRYGRIIVHEQILLCQFDGAKTVTCINARMLAARLQDALEKSMPIASTDVISC